MNAAYTTDRGPGRLETEAERATFGAATHYARVHDLGRPAERAYSNVLPVARSDILHRLIAGLCRSRPAGLKEPALVETDRDALADVLSFDGSVNVIEHVPSACERLGILPFPKSDTALVVPVEAVCGFDRLRTTDPVIAATSDGAKAVSHPLEVVDLLEREGAFVDADQADLIESELAESVANLALARLASRVQAEELSPDVLLDAPDRAPAASGPAAVERIVTDGHPLHPSAKIRRGMSAADGLAYAPEFVESVSLRFVAVDRSWTRSVQVGGDSLTTRLHAAFEGLEAALGRAVPADRDPGEYAVIPVHPWQYHHVVPERYERHRADGLVVPISDFAQPATPLLNLRTVVPYEGDGTGEMPFHCKLAIGVRTTNVERTLSPQAVHNGPRVTRLLREIDADEGFEALGFLDELAATCYYPPDGPHTDGEAFDDVRHLSGLVRQRPFATALAGDDERVLPASGLVADAPGTDRPLVREVLDRYAETIEATDAGDAAHSFIDAYVDVVVPDHLILLSKYGVALESHLQNCLVVFDEWRPVGVLARDFGGVRVHHDRLAEHGRSVETYPDSDVDADGREDLYRKLYYALFQNHLASVVAAVARSAPAAEAALWRIVRERSLSAFEELRADPSVPDRCVDRDERALLADPITYKALTAMRLQGKRHEYVTSQVSNPLATPSTLPTR